MLALCGATAFTMPSWAQVEDPTLTFADPDLDAIKEGAKEVYYVYHVGTGHFMTSGNGLHTWGTDLVVAEQGREVTLTYGKDYELSARDKSDPEYSDAASFRLSMMDAPSNGGFHELFLDASGDVYVDHNKQGHILWDIKPQVDGSYRISVNAEDPIYGAGNPNYEGSLMGVTPSENGWVESTWVDPLIIEGAAGHENTGFDWKFVEPEVYEAYKARLNLYEQLTLAEERGFTDYAAYDAVYQNEKATAEEINQAVEDLKADLVDFGYSVASESNPMDVSGMMLNPSFLNAGGGATADGWTSWRETSDGNLQAQAGRYSEFTTPDGHPFGDFFERWVPSGLQGDWYVEQALEGLPDGKYRLGAYIMTNNTEANGGSAGLFLYAKTVGGERVKEADQASPDGSTWAYPYSLDFNVIGGMATVGMRSEGYASNWSAVGYFTLQYMGPDETADMREAVRNNIAEIEQRYTDEMENTAHGQAEDEAYQAVLATTKEAVENTSVTNDSLTNLVVALQDSYDAMTSSASQYATLLTRIESLWSLWDNNAAYVDLDLPDYEEYLNGLQGEYDARTFDMEQLDSIQPRGEQLWKECIMSALASEATNDVTGMVSDNGWTKTGDAGYEEGYLTDEVWNGRNWEVYQELTGLPEGSYKITAQAFYSPSSTNSNSWHENYGVEGDQTNAIHGFLFANDASVPLAHIWHGSTRVCAQHIRFAFPAGLPACI